MIGLMNVPEEMPTEFYSAARRVVSGLAERASTATTSVLLLATSSRLFQQQASVAARNNSTERRCRPSPAAVDTKNYGGSSSSDDDDFCPANGPLFCSETTTSPHGSTTLLQFLNSKNNNFGDIRNFLLTLKTKTETAQATETSAQQQLQGLWSLRTASQQQPSQSSVTLRFIVNSLTKAAEGSC